ncbi:A/G-specific adenine glycosylase [Cocleimonas flava]|uniref:Adenine DNA glycosylase n=1 Tax=Cocleimonas flava TaxID=634765 RepID=A0A4V2P9D3_9GAMM|nr:A/G-specific adenine glycosylase [Cocleimonas flava]TCJ89165.1 A/G-specific DNA-adenine glycosylase [Cocleimonas flava]
MSKNKLSFADKLLHWFDDHGRKDLPWQQDISPYRVWVSEIMLQQTQVKTVIPYFQRFMESFPTVTALANSEQDEVLKHWSGLGYYARARNMHAAAIMVRDEFNGEFPRDIENIQHLKGIGRSTGAAILSIASNLPEPILDGNVKRVLSRVFAVEGWAGKSAVLKELWTLAEQTTPKTRNADYTQAIMDLGATLCTRSKPRCDDCPMKSDCIAFADSRQAELPAKKPKKIIPEKKTIMLIVKDEAGDVFMQKRPPTGIWGGLWCFPQFETQHEAENWTQEFLGEWSEKVQRHDVLSHTFSHFKLHIQPLIIQLKAPIKMSVMEKTDKLWYNVNTEFNGGLAAPVSTLLNTLVRQ